MLGIKTFDISGAWTGKYIFNSHKVFLPVWGIGSEFTEIVADEIFEGGDGMSFNVKFNNKIFGGFKGVGKDVHGEVTHNFSMKGEIIDQRLVQITKSYPVRPHFPDAELDRATEGFELLPDIEMRYLDKTEPRIFYTGFVVSEDVISGTWLFLPVIKKIKNARMLLNGASGSFEMRRDQQVLAIPEQIEKEKNEATNAQLTEAAIAIALAKALAARGRRGQTN